VQKEQGRLVAGKGDFAWIQRPQFALIGVGAAIKPRSSLPAMAVAVCSAISTLKMRSALTTQLPIPRLGVPKGRTIGITISPTSPPR
jgi:hypothetical protein